MACCKKCDVWVPDDQINCPYCGGPLEKESTESSETKAAEEHSTVHQASARNNGKFSKKIPILAVSAVLILGVVVALPFIADSRAVSDSNTQTASVSAVDTNAASNNAQIQTEADGSLMSTDTTAKKSEQTGLQDKNSGSQTENQKQTETNEAASDEASAAPTAAAEENLKYVYNCDYGLYLWKDTKCSDYHCLVNLGDEVNVLEEVSGTDYDKVDYNGTVGYLNRKYLSDEKPDIDTTTKKTMYVILNNTPFREYPTSNSQILEKLASGTEVGYIMSMNDATEFAKVNYNGTIGYILYTSLTESKPLSTDDTYYSDSYYDSDYSSDYDYDYSSDYDYDYDYDFGSGDWTITDFEY